MYSDKMTDPVGFRLNDKEHPDRVERLNALEQKWGIDPANVIRKLVDAYLEYVDEHGGQFPSFPVAVVPKADLGREAEKPKPGAKKRAERRGAVASDSGADAGAPQKDVD